MTNLTFKIKKNKQKDIVWGHSLQFKQFYSIPSDIYEQDFLLGVSASKKSRLSQGTDSLMLRKPSSLPNPKQSKLRQTSNKETVKYQKDMMISVKYLIQMNARISDYHKLGNNKYNEYLFSNDSLKNRYIDKRDMLIRSNNLTLAIINVKSE